MSMTLMMLPGIWCLQRRTPYPSRVGTKGLTAGSPNRAGRGAARSLAGDARQLP